MILPRRRDGTASGARARHRRSRTARLFGVLVGGLAAAAGAAFVLGLFHFIGTISAYEITSPPKRADAIVALTGGSARISDAVELLEKGHAQRLLITGVHPGNTPQTLTGFAPGRAGLFDCCVDLGYTALNTVGNAKETSDWARHRGYQSLIVVTSSYHLPRSLNELRREMPDTMLIPHAVVTDHLALERWWQDPEITRLLLSEYAKYLLSLAQLRWRPSTTLDAGVTSAAAQD